MLEKGKFDFSTAKPAAPDAVPDWAKGAPKRKFVDPYEKEQPNTALGANTGGEK